MDLLNCGRHDRPIRKESKHGRHPETAQGNRNTLWNRWWCPLFIPQRSTPHFSVGGIQYNPWDWDGLSCVFLNGARRKTPSVSRWLTHKAILICHPQVGNEPLGFKESQQIRHASLNWGTRQLFFSPGRCLDHKSRQPSANHPWWWFDDCFLIPA